MKIIICGNYGAKNIGDEMILKELIKSVKSANERAEITVLSADPSETANTFKVKSVEKFASGIRSFFKKALKKNETKEEVKNCDCVILGGGGLFGNSLKADIIWGIQAFWPYFYKKPVIIYGQSVGKPSTKIGKWIMKKVFAKAALISVRDEESKENIKSLGINKEIHVIPDLAFRSGFSNAKSGLNKAIIVLRQLKNLPGNFIAEISKFASWLGEKGLKIKIMDFQGGEKGENDSMIHKKLIESLKNNEGIEYIKNLNHESAINHFFGADFVLGTRLHSIISAIKTETPFIAINYAAKVAGLLKHAKLEKFMIEMEEIGLEKLKQLYETVMKEKNEATEKMKNYNEYAKESHEKAESKTLKEFFTGLIK